MNSATYLSNNTRLKQLGFLIACYKRKFGPVSLTPNPYHRLNGPADFIRAEYTLLRSWRNQHMPYVSEESSVARLKDEGTRAVNAAASAHSLFGRWYLHTEVIVRSGATPSATIAAATSGTSTRKTVMTLPLSAARIYRPSFRYVPSAGFFPVRITGSELADMGGGLPPVRIYRMDAFHIPPKVLFDCALISLPVAPMYYLKHEDFVVHAKTRHGALSGARTRLTNKLLKSLGE